MGTASRKSATTGLMASVVVPSESPGPNTSSNRFWFSSVRKLSGMLTQWVGTVRPSRSRKTNNSHSGVSNRRVRRAVRFMICSRETVSQSWAEYFSTVSSRS